MFKIKAKISGTDCEIIGYPFSVYGNGIDSIITEDCQTEYIKTDTVEVITDDYSPYNQGRQAWDMYILYNQKRKIPFKEGTDEFFEYQRGWNQNFNGISRKELRTIKLNELINMYRYFIKSLIENDCIKGVGTIQTAKELLRKIDL